jgi:hypothetical protein
MVEGRRRLKTEHAISRHRIYNRTDEVILISSDFKGLFHGMTEIPYGRYIVRCPVSDIEYNRLLTGFQKAYPQFIVEVGIGTIEEI